jgi:DNA-binding transcriptional LysR family regulator
VAELQNRSVDQLSEMRVFVRAIERGTFAGAADDLGLTPSAVSKLIARLEARLGVRLVNRTTRKLSLTAEGETYFQSGRQLVHALDGLEQEVAASASRPRGLLRVNTPVPLGVHHLAPALIEFHRRYPDVRVNLSLTDRFVDFYAEQIDVAVRMGPLSDSRLMSRKIAEIEAVLAASPRYIEEFGIPKRVRTSCTTAASCSPRRVATAGPSGPPTAVWSTSRWPPPLPATACSAFCSWPWRAGASPDSPTSWSLTRSAPAS